MSNDVSRIYQFLATDTDWKTKADKNGDGTIIKSEFRSYMEENFEWDGETTDAGKNDLINSFWKSVDANQKSGKISGTKYRNKNALDSKEIASMEERIAIYERVNEFTSTISAPSVISDSSAWKKSVSAGIAAKVEIFIQNGGKIEDLDAFLEEEAPTIKNKATADYCANEYLNDNMKDFVKEYGYSYAEDSSLQNLINNYINNIPEDSDVYDIQMNVTEIIKNYMATAGLGEENGAVDLELLATYGYNTSESATLNELQKSVLKKNIEKALEDVKKEDDYTKNSKLYDAAVVEYVNNLLENTKSGDFTNAMNYGISEFKESEAYKDMQKTISVKNIFTGDALKSAITSNLSSVFADKITGLMSGELTAYDEIMNATIEKAKNGDFDIDGVLNQQKVVDYVVEQITSRLTEFYPNGLSDMPLSDLNTMYDKLVESAKANDDSAAVKTAATSYCKAVIAKGNVFAQAVKDVFGETYASEIAKNLTTPEIESKMEELKAKIVEFGDISKITEAEKNALLADVKDSYTFEQNAVDNKIQLPTSATCSGKTVTSDRISYSSTGCVSVDKNGNLAIDTSKSGTYTGQISVSIDGNVIATKSITVTVQAGVSEIVAKTTDKTLSLNESIDNWNTNANFQDLYNGDKTVILYGKMDKRNRDWSHKKNDIKATLSTLGTQVVDVLATAGLDKAKLNTAAQTVVNRYVDAGAIKNKNNNGTKQKDLINHCNEYMTANRNNTKSRIVWTVDTDGRDSNVYMIHFKDFVDDIIAEYRKLAA
mgnify:CR=1 FL=1